MKTKPVFLGPRYLKMKQHISGSLKVHSTSKLKLKKDNKTTTSAAFRI